MAKLALRDVIASRPVRTVRALLMRALDGASAVARGAPEGSPLSRLPKAAETRRVVGLRGAVTIGRDAFGVPGIFADELPDLAFGMGWACAEDRLFQMELARRALLGTLSAVVGDRPIDDPPSELLRGRTMVDVDLLSRTLDFRRAAEASYALASTEGRAWVDGFAAGVNGFLQSGRRPIEMLVLDMEPEPWTGADCMLLAKGMHFQLTFAWRYALAQAVADATLGPEHGKRLAITPHPVAVTRRDAEGLREALLSADVLSAILGGLGEARGSNAVAVAPSRSTDGRAMVASDPHMPLTAPGVFWECRLSGGDIDVRGFGPPGVPVLPFAQNAHGAWAVTAGWADDTQLYREDLAALRREGALKTEVVRIEVKGESTRERAVLRTPRGPIITPLVGGGVAGEGEVGFSLAWTGASATLEIDAALGVMRAQSFGALREALALHGGPTLNFVWADAAGHIGWALAGKVPVRAGNLDDDGAPVVRPLDERIDGLCILDGDDPRGAWRGSVPWESMPYLEDPASGVIVSANTRPAPNDHPHHFGRTFQPPYRLARLRALLDACGTVGPRELAAMQLDVRSAWAAAMRDSLLHGLSDEALGLPHRRGTAVISAMRAWDGRADRDSAGAAATYTFIDCVLRHVLLDELGDEAFALTFETLGVRSPMIARLVARRGGHPLLTSDERATIVRDAAAMAEGRLRRRLGDDPARWRWGALHQATFRHPFGEVRGLRTVSSPGPFEVGGDGTTVNMGEFASSHPDRVRVAPSLRTVMIAGAPEEARAVLPPGQSGDPASRHYRDQAAMWAHGEDRPARWAEADFMIGRTRFTSQ